MSEVEVDKVLHPHSHPFCIAAACFARMQCVEGSAAAIGIASCLYGILSGLASPHELVHCVSAAALDVALRLR